MPQFKLLKSSICLARAAASLPSESALTHRRLLTVFAGDVTHADEQTSHATVSSQQVEPLSVDNHDGPGHNNQKEAPSRWPKHSASHNALYPYTDGNKTAYTDYCATLSRIGCIGRSQNTSRHPP